MPDFTTTGRPMSRRLQHAIDTLTSPAETAQALEEGATRDPEQSDFGRLMAAVGFEVRLRIAAEAAALRDLDADARSSLPDGPPLPVADGEPWWPDVA